MKIIEQFNFEAEGKNFIDRELCIKTSIIKSYQIVMFIFCIVALIGVAVYVLHSDIEAMFVNIFVGIVLYFIAVPFHELVHALGYVLIGGKANIKFGIGKGMFYCACNDFECSGGKYVFDALLPMTLITCASIVFMFFCSSYVLGMIIFNILHLWSSNGDVAIVSFLKRHNNPYAISHSHNKMLIFYEK